MKKYSKLIIFILLFMGKMNLSCSPNNEEEYSPIIIEPALPNSVWPMNSSETIDIFRITINYGKEPTDINNPPRFRLFDRNNIVFYLNRTEYDSFISVFNRFIEWDEIARENRVIVNRREIPGSIIGEQLSRSIGGHGTFYGEHIDRMGWTNSGSIDFYFSSDGNNGILTISPNINFRHEGLSHSPVPMSLNLEQVKTIFETYTEEYLQRIHNENLAIRNQREELQDLRRQEEMERQELEDILFR